MIPPSPLASDPSTDVEAPNDEASQIKSPAVAFAAAPASDSGSVGGASGLLHSAPVVLSKLVLREVVQLLTSGGIFACVKEFGVGVILGMFLISVLIFLDHRDVVHVQSAHNFRNAAFQLLNDPETLATLEESSDLKFMIASEYDGKRLEIDNADEKMAKVAEDLERKTKDAEEKRKEVESIREEYDKLMANPLLGLEKYCGTCVWAGKYTCDGRLQFLKDTYGTRPIEGKISVMEVPTCIKQ